MGVGRSSSASRSTSSSRYDTYRTVGGGPSPARIDSQGRRIVTEYIDNTKKLPNPDPANYNVKLVEQVGKFLVVKIHYPDCTNFEGNKILVFKGATAGDLLKQKLIDPHFFENPKIKSPIARFAPTDEGWRMALRFAEGESKQISSQV